MGEAQVPHRQGAHVAGIFVPLAVHARRVAVFAEDVASRITFVNSPTERTALQSWKYQALASAGWQVVPVPNAAWRQNTDAVARADLLRELLQNPLDVTTL